MRGPAGYGRYDDSPEYVGCPYAKTDMIPCIARDGSLALAGSPPVSCAGCGHKPGELLKELAVEYAPARSTVLRDPVTAANQLRDLVRQATEPGK